MKKTTELYFAKRRWMEERPNGFLPHPAGSLARIVRHWASPLLFLGVLPWERGLHAAGAFETCEGFEKQTKLRCLVFFRKRGAVSS